MLADRLAATAEWRVEKAWQADVARLGDVFICKPRTFMNLSGGAVSMVAGFYKITPVEVLTILDDMALPLGKLRFRAGGSAGGHNGLQSILDHLGTREVARLRIGIGSATPGDAVGHVLGRFTFEEQAALEQTLNRAADAVACVQAQGLEAAMNLYN